MSSTDLHTSQHACKSGEAGPSTLLAASRRRKLGSNIISYGTFSNPTSIAPSARSSKVPSEGYEGEQDEDLDNVEKELQHISTPRIFGPSLRLSNEGCVARDHLASERTFLAYVGRARGRRAACAAKQCGPPYAR